MEISADLENKNWYLEHKDDIHNDVQGFLEHVRPLLEKDYGEDKAQTILSKTWQDFDASLGSLPYIGGHANPLTFNLYVSAACLSLYKVLGSAPLTGKYLYQACFALYRSLPQEKEGEAIPAEELAYKLGLGAEESKKRKYPGDWVYDFIPGDDSLDFGIDYTECGIVKYFKSRGAEEFTPYLCLLDFPLSIVMDTGLVRTTTLACGGSCCDFRFRTGRKVQMEWEPDYVRE